jgi:hypothetical protein
MEGSAVTYSRYSRAISMKQENFSQDKPVSRRRFEPSTSQIGICGVTSNAEPFGKFRGDFYVCFECSRRRHEMRLSRAASRVRGCLRFPLSGIGAVGGAETSSLHHRGQERSEEWMKGKVVG